jgi:predicted PurR-regulated permease PerM
VNEGGHRARPPPDPRPDRASRDRNELRASLTAVGIIVALSLFIYLIRSILLPFVVAGILGYVCTPLVDLTAARTRLPRWLCATLVLLALLAIFAFVGWLGLPTLADEVSRVGGHLQASVESFARELIGKGDINMLGETINAHTIAVSVAGSIRGWLDQGGSVAKVTAYGFAGMFGLILSWVLLGYMLLDAKRLSDGLFWLVPPHHRPFVHRVWNDLNPVLRRYFIGVGMVVVYAATVAYIGLGLILHIHHALLLALLTGFLEVIPIVGPAASAVIAGLVAVQEATSSWNIIAYVIYATVLRISIDEFFGPIVLGRAAYVPPVLVIFCFLSGAVLFGIVGVILAVPVALTVKATLYELYKEESDAEAA